MYILFEGIDTCGKSTQIELLKHRFHNSIVTKEPGGTNFGVEARSILLRDELKSKRAELLLFLADRAEHYEEVIKPNKNKLILSDRGFLSGIGYALANGDFDFQSLLHLNKFSLEDTLPDRIILFITDRETLTQRSKEKQLDGIELRGLEYLMLVQTKMQESITNLDIPYLIIDATKDIASIEKKLFEYINKEL